MTDAEITKLCAQACCEKGMLLPQPGFCAAYVDGEILDPLNKDAHAMALVKHLKLDIGNINGAYWVVTEGPKGGNAAEWTKSDDLNRAICECVARMQKEKNKNRLQPGTS